jgi:hypothetical protein
MGTNPFKKAQQTPGAKNALRMLGILGLIGLFSLGLVLFFSMAVTPPAEGHRHLPGDPLSSEELALIQAGDVILRKGNSLVSTLIEDSLGEAVPLSHVALVVERPQGLGVIHSISSNLSGIDGIQFQYLSQFVRHSDPDSTIVLRPQLSDQELATVLNRGESLLAMAVPFDHSFDLSGSEELYCSELLTVLFEEVQFWTDQHPVITHAFGWVAFETFWAHPGFAVVLDHTGLLKDLRG